MQDWCFSLHPFSDVLKFDGVFSLKCIKCSIDSIRISERMDSTQCSGLIVPYAPHSGRWASRGASRLVRPEKGNKNGPMSKLTGPFLFPFSGC